jgi:phosphatidylinositol alpha 1,6-mannosyltransferase
MDTNQLRIALFSGNYNYVRDGANQALNRLVDYLLRQGAAVRVYAPTTDTPAFEPAGDLVSVPSLPIPGRGEYRIALGLPAHIRDDLKRFAPNMLHVSAPDILGHRAVSFARSHGIPVIASMHTRFETYLRYYGLSLFEPALEAMIRRFYQRCDAVVAPSQSMADIMRAQRMSDDISIWARGIDRTIFNPGRRDQAWRDTFGLQPNDVAIGFLGRLVMEKGLDVFADVVERLNRGHVPHKVLVIGEGPAKGWFQSKVPEAIFAGFQQGADLGRAVASMDVLFNPSVTETFGNVTLEAMACRIPVVAARATGSENLVADCKTGRLISPSDMQGYADAISTYCQDESLRLSHGLAGEAASLPYDWDRINQAVVDTYVRVIGRAAYA